MLILSGTMTGSGTRALWVVLAMLAQVAAFAAPVERSFWAHASLGLFTQRNYFGTNYPETAMPTREQIGNAARLLQDTYAANRLYLIYHRELPLADARQLFRSWHAAAAGLEIVPTLVLRMYDSANTAVFTEAELEALAVFFQSEVNSRCLAIYDIAAGRNNGPGVSLLARKYPRGLIRVGLQPSEPLEPFTGAVADTWGAFCHGKSNEQDWQQPGFGASTLRKWVAARNAGALPVAWNLIALAWDYSATQRGGYPGYDDASKNMPLPAGRNRLAANLIRTTARPERWRGFSSDLYILHENSRSPAHDGRNNSFYETLKRGEPYRGYYCVPFKEITDLYREMRESEGQANKLHE